MRQWETQEIDLMCETLQVVNFSSSPAVMDYGGPGHARLVGDYILGPRIGWGSFSVVWRATHRKLGMEVAVKEIEKKVLSSEVRENLLKEISILSTISHPNIIRLIEAIETEDRIYLVLEYCDGGDLAGYIYRPGRVSEDVARHFMRQLASGLQVLHEKDLIHGGLKPQNLLLSTKETTPLLKIGYFGFARSVKKSLADTLCGSPLYMAPEITKNQKYNAKADLWSVGAILFQLVTGKPPFDGNNQDQLFRNVLETTEVPFPKDSLEKLNPDCVDLCRRLLRQNPDERLTFEEFFHHKFLRELRQNVDLESNSLVPQPKLMTEPSDEMDSAARLSDIPESVLKSVNFDSLEGSLNIKFKDRSLLVEAITHASHPSAGVSSYERLEFVGDAILDYLITRHLFFTYTNLPPGRLTDLRAAAVNNEYFARVAVKHNLHLHLRHGSSALEKQIQDFVKEVQNELSKPGFNFFGLGDCQAPKVLADILESIAGAIFLDSGKDTGVVWKVFQPLFHPMVTPETLPMDPVRELQERCQQQAEGLDYKATRSGNLTTVEVFVDGEQVGLAQNPQTDMARKLAARNALAVLKEKERAEAKLIAEENGQKKNGNQSFTRQSLNEICQRRNWPMPLYRRVSEGGTAHAKRFTFAVRVNTTDRGWTDECVGEPMPSVKKAKDSAALLLLELLNKWYS